MVRRRPVLSRSSPTSAHGRLHLACPARGLLPLLALLSLNACLAEDDPSIGHLSQAAQVSDYLTSSCSTEVVLGLSLQIADEVTCMEPDAFVTFEEGDGIVFTGSAVLPYMTPAGKTDLLAAVAAHGGELRINSAFRTVAQQYLLREWFERGRCSITAAAQPGQSNHESGRAIDVGNYGEWVTALGNKRWGHTVPGDEVHFDHLDSPDLRGYDVLAFQRLWNRNHPEDEIDEDGAYGPETGARLARSPADGFATGACDGGDQAVPYGGALVAVDAPESLPPAAQAQVTVTVRNTGTETWAPGTTFLGTTDPQDRASALYDAESWPSPSRAATVAAETPPGAVGSFTFTIVAPATDETLVNESFGLVQDGVGWFQPASIEVSFLVSSTAEESSGDFTGGCRATGGTGGAWWLALIALLGLARRRR